MKTRDDLQDDQLDCIEFIGAGEDSLVCADVGTGKTVISLTAMLYAIERQEVTRWLVLAPLLVATDTWAQEPSEWSHLKGLDIAIACGSENDRIKAIESDAEIVAMNYENLQWLMDHYPRTRRGRPETLPFDGLVCDEIDKLKSVSSKRFKSFRNRIGIFRKRIGLTGTLTPNDLEETWGQTYLLDEGKSFGRSFYKWRSKYFYPTDFNQHNWTPLPGTREEIISQLSDLVFRLPAVGLPEVVLEKSVMLEMATAARSVYKKLEKDFYIELNKGRHSVEAANEAVLGGKLQQICSGFSYADGEEKEVIWHSKARFEWLEELIEQMRLANEQLLIFYHFNAERDELIRRYPDIAHLGPGVSNTQARKIIGQWNEGRIPLLELHPASAGHGLNLQKSGACHIAFLTIPWSGGMFKQVVGRLARRGQVSERIYVHTAQFKATVDNKVFGVVTDKLDRMEDFLDDLGAAATSS